MEPTRRRALVLTDEGARHPFRATLPPHCRHELPEEGETPARGLGGDLRWFASCYGACFAAVSVFLV